MSHFEQVFERIKHATSTRTQVDLAEVLDIRQSSISDAKRRDSVPADWYMKLFERFGLNPDWLKKGVGPMYLRTSEGYCPADGPSLQLFEEGARYGDPDAKSTVVTVYSGSVPDEVQTDINGMHQLTPVGLLSLPLSFSEKGIRVVRVEASSMEPIVHKGAYVGLDTSRTSVVSGELYGVFIPHEGVVIKRIFLDATNEQFILRSENPAHPETSFPVAQRSERIVGSVAWVLQRY